MSAYPASSTAWTVKSVAKFKAFTAPVEKNFCNVIDDAFGGEYRTLSFFAVGSGAWVISWAISKGFGSEDPVSWGWVAFFAAAFAMLIIVPLLRREAIPAPRWNKYSLSAVLAVWDILLPQDHPLRRTVAEQRVFHPEAEFEVEYLEPSPDDAGRVPPRFHILWMYPEPFESDRREPMLVLSGEKVVPPSF